MTGRTKLAWLLGLSVAAAISVYSPVLRAGLVWDDKIVQAVQMPYFTSLREAFLPSAQAPELTWSYYRPLVFVTYMADQAVTRGLGLQGDLLRSAPVPHATNLLLHAAATGLVFLLALRLLGTGDHARWGAGASSLLFAVHPIHAESVCSVAGRTDLLATLFVLATCLLALRFRDRGRTGALVGVAATLLLGLLSKEVALSAMVVVPAVLLLVPPVRDAEEPIPPLWWARLAGAVLGAVAVYFVLRVAAGANLAANGPALPGSWIGRLLGALTYYGTKGVIPWPQSHFVPGIPSAGLRLVPLLGGLLCLGWIALRRPESRRVLLVGFLCFGASVAPSLWVVLRPVSVTPLAERYLYLPSVILCLLAGAAVARSLQGRVAGIAVAATTCVVLVFGASSVARTAVWQSDLRFWADVLRSPEASRSSLALSNAGVAYVEAGQYRRALELYQKALTPEVAADESGRLNTYHNLGTLYLELAVKLLGQGQPGQALPMAQTATWYLEPVAARLGDVAYPHEALGVALLTQAKAAERLNGHADVPLLGRARQSLLAAARLNHRDAGTQASLRECEALLRRGSGVGGG
ncbi:MAG: tetratricopeptide repeat protein [Deltaproteobacteria bacterium]|nr:tetratricopeptide repeat protein [Deltaproteobacteria bacterium]